MEENVLNGRIPIQQTENWTSLISLTSPLVQIMLGIVILVCIVAAFSKSKRGPRCTSTSVEGEVEDILRSVGAPVDGSICEEATMVPSTGLFLGNAEETAPFENEFVTGKFLTMHRATYDKDLNKSGEYRYGEYFLGKKRLWEARFQWSFKKQPPRTQDMFFGIELEEYVFMNAATKRMMSILVENLKVAVGKNIYHTPGDDPAKVSGVLERPAFVMPLYAFDQYIVTPPGETPPSLMDPNMPNLGSKRVSRVREFKKEIEQLEFKKGYTYTFNFWGISQWLDRLNWEVIMPLVRTRVDFDQFAGRPPVHVVVYTLKADGNGKADPRRLDSRKSYYVDVAFWSSIRRPPREVVSKLFENVKKLSSEEIRDKQRRNVIADRPRSSSTDGQSNGLFACCIGR